MSVIINPNLDSSDKLFSHFKGYKSPTNTYGGLTVPNDEFIEYVAKIENEMVSSFTKVMGNKGVAKEMTRQQPLCAIVS